MPDPLAYKRIDHTIDAGFGVEQVYELPFVLMDVTAKKVVSYLTNRTLYSNKFLPVSGDLSWRDIRKGNVVTLTAPKRNMTAVTYMAHQVRFDGRGRVSGVLRPYHANIYADVALSTPTAWTPTSGYGNLYEVPYVTVSPTAGEGMFTTIADALANLPDWVRRIILMRGIHVIGNDGVWLPYGRGLEILGESKTETIVQNNPLDCCFAIEPNQTSRQTYRFANFTIQSQNTSPSTAPMIYAETIMDLPVEVVDANIIVEDVNFELTSYDRAAIGVYNITGGLKVSRIRSSGGGESPILIDNLDEATLIDNEILDAEIGMSLYRVSNLYVAGNKIKEFSDKGLYVYGASGTEAELNQVSENIIKSSVASANIGLHALYCQRTVFGENIVKMAVDYAVTTTKGILLDQCADCQIINNPVRLANADGTYNNYGLQAINTTYSVIAGNQFNLVNSRATDRGVFLTSTSNYNRGSDNMAINVGTAKTDTGTGNAVLVNGA